MLLEFKVKNYKSFKEEAVFSMIPAQKQKGLDYSILNEKIGSSNYKALSSAVIYGPNASGKTNLISAIDTLKTIVLKGNIFNSTARSVSNPAASELELIPNIDNVGAEPVRFAIKFIESNILFEYELEVYLGEFLSNGYERKIKFEQLSVNNNILFTREERIKFGELKKTKKYLNKTFLDNIDVAKSIATANVQQQDLFLANSFKVVVSDKLVAHIMRWFDKKLMVFCRANSMILTKKVADNDVDKDKVYIDEFVTAAVKEFGAMNAIGYIAPKGEKEGILSSLLEFGKNNISIPADIFESQGTVRFVNILPIIGHALLYGHVLVFDEFDASIHPMALMNIINIFHNEQININKAQLIFNTHNPIFLNCNLFRRDEIKFVERNEATHNSEHYSLADFGTNGEKGVRKSEDYMKNYFISHYGAIKDVDFSPIFEKIIQNHKDD